RDVIPEALQALVATEQRREDRRVREKNVAGTFPRRRHPQEHVELAVPGLGEWMRMRHVDRLSRQHVDGARLVSRYGIVRQVRMEVESRYAVEPATGIVVTCL